MWLSHPVYMYLLLFFFTAHQTRKFNTEIYREIRFKIFWRTTMLHVQFVILVLLCNSYIFISRQCVQRSLVLLFNSYHCFLSLIPWGLFDKIGQLMHLRTYTIGYDDSKVSSMIFLLYNMLLYCHLLEYMRIFGSLRIFKKSFIDGYKKILFRWSMWPSMPLISCLLRRGISKEKSVIRVIICSGEQTGVWPLVAFGWIQIVLFFRVKICCTTRKSFIFVVWFISFLVVWWLQDYFRLGIIGCWYGMRANGKKSNLIGFEALWILYNVHSRRESILITMLNLIFAC